MESEKVYFSESSDSSCEEEIEEQNFEGVLATVDTGMVQPYQFEPEADVSSCSSEEDQNPDEPENNRLKNLDWYGVSEIDQIFFVLFVFAMTAQQII